MRKFILIVLLFANSVSAAEHYILALPSALPENVNGKELYQRTVKKIVKELKPGDSFYVINAYNMNTIMSLKMPLEQAYSHEKVKYKYAKYELSKLKRHLKKSSQSMAINDEINFPRLTQHVSVLITDHIPAPKKISMMVIGNALYLDKREDNIFSFKDGWFPSDGHIAVSEKSSPFGTQGKQSYLGNYSISMLYTNDDFVSPLYKYRINRFWSLFTKAQGGELSTFTNDLTVAFERFQPELKSRESFGFDSTIDKVEMLRATRTKESISLGTANNNDNFMLEGDATNSSPILSRGLIKLGIRWDTCGNCDFDLYVKAPGEKALSFRNRNSDSGSYYKDFQSSPQAKNGLVYVT